MKDQNFGWISKNVACWVMQQGKLMPATVAFTNPKKKSAFIEFQEKGIKGSQCVYTQLYQRESKPQDYPDLSGCQILNQAEILKKLQYRLIKENIYTSIGKILLAANPFKNLEQKLYSKEQFLKFQNFKFSAEQPHIYGFAANLRRQLQEKGLNQTLIISGQSGAGKTQNTKKALYFLANLNRKESKEQVSLENRILACNPVLQAFGNSKTLRNDNSSRFGKLLRLQYNQRYQIIGANINKYLLQKSRVASVQQGQTNFHIFYHLLEHQSFIKKLKFDFSNFPILGKERLSYSEASIQQIQKSLKQIGFKQDQIQEFFLIIIAILFLSKVSFSEKTLTDTDPCQIQDNTSFQVACSLLNLNPQLLRVSLLFKRRVISNTQILTPQKKFMCINNRDSLNKFLYDSLFDIIVQGINSTLKSSLTPKNTINLLDIFGFQSLQINSLQQICINYANQKLQQLFVDILFRAEIQQYARAGIQAQQLGITYLDNKPLVDLFETPPKCLFQILIDSCKLAGDSDQSLGNKYQKSFQGSAYFQRSRTTQNFIIKHSPMNIQYSVSGFRKKNVDQMKIQTISTLKQSSSRTLQAIVSIAQREKGKFLVAKFRSQMNQLMRQINSSTTHFVKCIKSNAKRLPCFLDTDQVLRQLKYLGILETIKIRKFGYPTRMQFKFFLNKYRLIALDQKPLDQIHKIKAIMSQTKIKENTFLLSKAKVFMKSQAVDSLNRKIQQIYETKVKRLRKVISQFRVYKFRKITNKRIKLIRNLRKLPTTTQLEREPLRRIKEQVLRLLRANAQKSKRIRQLQSQLKKQKDKRLSQLKSKAQEMPKKVQLSSRSINQIQVNVKDQISNQSHPQNRSKQIRSVKLKISQKQIEVRKAQDLNRVGRLPLWSSQVECFKDNREVNSLLMIQGKPMVSQIIEINKQRFIELSKYEQSHIQIIRTCDFKEFYSKFINPKRLKGIKIQSKQALKDLVSKTLTFQNKQISCSLLDHQGLFNKQSILGFSYILKILKEKDSRFKPEDNLLSLIYLCSGIYKDPNSGKIIKIMDKLKLREQLLSKYSTQSKYYSTDKQNESAWWTLKTQGSRLLQTSFNQFNFSEIMQSNIKGIANRFSQVFNLPLLRLRDQIYFQLIKQSIDCKKSKGYQQKILEIFLALARTVVPSYRAIYPLANFILQKIQAEPLNKKALLIFQYLTCYIESYQILSLQSFQKPQLQMKRWKKFKQNIIDFSKIPFAIQFQYLKDYLQTLENRKCFDIKDSSRLVAQQSYGVNINTYTGGVLKMVIECWDTVRSLKIRIAKKLGLRMKAMFFGLYQQEQTFGELSNQKLLSNDLKIWDLIVMQEKSSRSMYSLNKKIVKYYFYFGIKFYFRLDSLNFNDVRLYYSQIKHQFLLSKFPFIIPTTFKLMALIFYRSNGPHNKSNQEILNQEIKFLIPRLYIHECKIQDWLAGCLKQYKPLTLASLSSAEFQFLKEARNFDFFGSHQYQAVQFGVKLQDTIYTKQQGRKVKMGIRPYHVIITDCKGTVLNQICFDQLTHWGKSESKCKALVLTNQYQQMTMYSFEEVQTADNLINGYVNWRMGQCLQEQSSQSSYNVISFKN